MFCLPCLPVCILSLEDSWEVNVFVSSHLESLVCGLNLFCELCKYEETMLLCLKLLPRTIACVTLFFRIPTLVERHVRRCWCDRCDQCPPCRRARFDRAADCQLQGEVSASLLEVSALNDLRGEASRWHTGATNVEKMIYYLKRLTIELASRENDDNPARDIFPTTPLQEGFVAFSGKSLEELRAELPDLEGRLFHLRAGSAMMAWSYFEKLVALENMAVDRSEGLSSLSNPFPTPAKEVTVESLLDCLIWATNKFGQLSAVIEKVQSAASSMAESSGSVCPKLDNQQNSLLRMSDAILGLAAHIKVNGDQGPPLLKEVKAIQKQLDNCAWQLSGSGAKLVNASLKELIMSIAKVLSECSAHLAKGVDHSQRTYEGMIALNENVKEGNQLLKELVEGQRMSLRHATQNLAQQQAQQQAPNLPIPPPAPVPPVSMGSPGVSPGASVIPAAFQNPALGAAASCARETSRRDPVYSNG